MKSKLALFSLLTVGVLLFCHPAFAHHGSRVSYDMTKKVTLKGVVAEYRYQNPHIYLMYDVKDDQGNVVHWGAETYSPIVMLTYHWDKHTLKPGDEVTVTVWPSKVGSPRGFLAKVVLPNGTVTDLETRQPE